MKVVEKVSWLMGRVQGNLFSHLNQCLKTPLTAQEERLVSILEIVQVVNGMSPRPCFAIAGPDAILTTGKTWLAHS